MIDKSFVSLLIVLIDESTHLILRKINPNITDFMNCTWRLTNNKIMESGNLLERILFHQRCEVLVFQILISFLDWENWHSNNISNFKSAYRNVIRSDMRKKKPNRFALRTNSLVKKGIDFTFQKINVDIHY